MALFTSTRTNAINTPLLATIEAMAAVNCSQISVAVLDWFDSTTYPTVSSRCKLSSPSPIPTEVTVESSTLSDDNDDEDDWDVVIGADVVWLEHLVPPLVQTLAIICKKKTKLLLSHQVDLSSDSLG